MTVLRIGYALLLLTVLGAGRVLRQHPECSGDSPFSC